MKYILVVFFLMATSLSFSQKNSKYNRAHVAFPGCESVKNIKEAKACYKTKMRQYIDSSLTSDVTRKIIKKSKKDTLILKSSLYFNEEGSVVKRHSKFSIYNLENSKKDLVYLVDNFPKIKPVLDNLNNGVADYASVSFYYKIDKDNNTLIPVKKPKFKKKPNNDSLKVIEHVPRYKGCNKELSNEVAKKCMGAKINMHISKNFNTNIGNRLNLSPGIKKIFVAFKINKKGKVDSIKALAPHPDLEKEAIRVIKLLPDFEPGMQRGKPVIVPYSLPITFKIVETAAQKRERKRLKRKKKFN